LEINRAVPLKLSIVTSIYKTAKELPEFYRRAVDAARTMGLEYEMILVNDASPDNGLAVAKALAAADPGVVVVDLARNYGQHKAVWAGLRASTGDLVAVLDSDLENDPHWLPLFRERMKVTGSDVAYGVYSTPPGSPIYRRGRKLFHFMLDAASGEQIPRNITTARLMTRSYVDGLLSFGETEIFLLGVWHLAGFSQLPVPVEISHKSLTSYTPWKLLGMFVRGVTSFSVMPLFLVFAAGIGLSLLSALFIVYLLVKKFIVGVGLEGWTSVMAAVMLLGGVTLFFNGIIAIYIGTIFLEVKRRPTIIREIVQSEAAEPRAGGSPRD
jgi:putative glycosyltransferase